MSLPKFKVSAPTPEGIRYGLFSSVPFSPMDIKAGAGVEWELSPGICSSAYGFNDECTGPAVINIPHPEYVKDCGVSGGTGFTVVYRVQGTPGNYGEGRAIAGLLATEERVVERALWTGDMGGLSLVAGATEVSTTIATNPRTALATLEQALADTYPYLGVIHMTRLAAQWLISDGSVAVSGNSLRTRMGTRVVAGIGYPGTGPSGGTEPVAHSWTYASGAIVGQRSDVYAGQFFDPATNTEVFGAFRDYVIGLDGCPDEAAINAGGYSGVFGIETKFGLGTTP